MLLAIWDDGAWQDLATIAAIALVAYLLILWVAAIVWTYRDVAARTSDTFTQTIALVLVIIFGIPGMLVYLVLRPKDTLMDAYDRQLEAEALLHEIQDQATCARCRRKVDHDFVACPFCRSPLRAPCSHCERLLAPSWVLCPYCGTERPQESPERVAPTLAASLPVTPDLPNRPKRASTATYTPQAPAGSSADIADLAP